MMRFGSGSFRTAFSNRKMRLFWKENEFEKKLLTNEKRLCYSITAMEEVFFLCLK